MKRLLTIVFCGMVLNSGAQLLSRKLRDSCITATVLRYYKSEFASPFNKGKKMLLLNLYDSSGWTLPPQLEPFVLPARTIDEIKDAVAQPPYNGRSMFYRLHTYASKDTFDITITYSGIKLNPPGSKYKCSIRGICQNWNPYARFTFSQLTQTWLFKNRDQLDYEEQLQWAGIPQTPEIN